MEQQIDVLETFPHFLILYNRTLQSFGFAYVPFYDGKRQRDMYDREKAVAYARRWALGRNPDFYDFSKIGGDCTNFASQVLYAGVGEMNNTPTFGWYYYGLNNRAPAWTGVNELYRFLITNKGPGPRAVETDIFGIEPGDIAQLDFNGDGIFDHSPVIVDVGRRTPRTVLVAAHSMDALDRPLRSYPYARVRFLHIV